MGVTYDTPTKNARLDLVARLVDGGTLEIGSAAFALVLAVIPLANPSAPAAVGGVLTFTMPESDTDVDATGTAALARIKDSGGTIRVSGLTVGVAASGADIIMNSVALQQHAAATVTAAAITHA